MSTGVRVLRWGWFGNGGGARRDQPVDRAVRWWLWNLASGARLGTGPAMSSDRSRTTRVLRGAGRLGAIATVVGLVWSSRGGSADRHLSDLVQAAVAGTAAAAVVVLAGSWVLAVWWHHHRWVRPLHLALHGPAGWPEDKRPRRYLRVPRTFMAAPDGVVVLLPKTFAGRPMERILIAQIVREKLALGDVTETWVLRGRHAYVQFRPKRRPPDRVLFSDPSVRELVERAKRSAPLLGLTNGDRPVAVDLDSESPHVLLSAGTGGGKSATIRAIAAQLMHHGATAWVLDAKRHSHAWLRDVPGVRYFRDVGEIHGALVSLAAEGRRRNEAFDDLGIDDAGPTFGRVVVICEELNATMSMLKQWWRNNRTSGDPTISPAITSLGELLFMGRAVRMHVLAVAQLATAKDLGGPEMRENYAVRILARYTSNAWKMLVPECTYVAATRHQGRQQVCIGGTATTTQGLFMTPHEARAWALAGAPATADVAMSHVAHTPSTLGKQAATVATPTRLSIVRDTEPDPVGISLAEASIDLGTGVVGLKRDALRQAARRDPEFPQPVRVDGKTRLFDPEELHRWERNRPGAKGQTL